MDELDAQEWEFDEPGFMDDLGEPQDDAGEAQGLQGEGNVGDLAGQDQFDDLGDGVGPEDQAELLLDQVGNGDGIEGFQGGGLGAQAGIHGDEWNFDDIGELLLDPRKSSLATPPEASARDLVDARRQLLHPRGRREQESVGKTLSALGSGLAVGFSPKVRDLYDQIDDYYEDQPQSDEELERQLDDAADPPPPPGAEDDGEQTTLDLPLFAAPGQLSLGSPSSTLIQTRRERLAKRQGRG